MQNDTNVVISATSSSTPVERVLKMGQDAEKLYFQSTAGRRLYDAKFGIAVTVVKCMDGRVDWSEASNSPFAWIYPIQTMGGKLDLGWPAFKPRFARAVRRAAEKQTPMLFVSTYHFSDQHALCCLGYGKKTVAAIGGQAKLRDQAERVASSLYLQGGVRQVYPILAGINTDNKGLILHGTGRDEVLATFEFAHLPQEEAERLVGRRIPQLFPDMPEGIVQYLIESTMRNWVIVKTVMENPPEPMALDHNEWILAIGNRMDWIRQRNIAVKIQSWDPEYLSSARTGARIIISNRDDKERGRSLREEGGVLIVCDSFDEDDERCDDRAAAVESALWTYQDVARNLRRNNPEILSVLKPLVGVVSTERRFHRLDVDERLWMA